MSDDETGTVNPTTFEWIIPSFREWFESGCNGYLYSPDFHQPDSSWYLCLSSRKEWITIGVYRQDTGIPQTITYTIKMKYRTDVAEITNTKYYDCRTDSNQTENFLKKEDIQNFNVLDSFTVICYITCDTTHPVAGKKFVTCAVQTEDVNVAVDKKTHKYEDLSSHDTKGKKFVTCAVQTEDVNVAVDKKTHKYEDLSSHDTKGVAVLSERMKQLLIKGGDHDVTIYVQKKEFRAHRNILSARSAVFSMMLAHDCKEKNTGTISIEHCDPESFEEFLLYVYSGRTENLTPSNALQLYYPADKYDFPVLKDWCVSLLKTSMSVESICDVVLLAAKHQENELLKVATEFFVRNIKKIVVTVGWQKFMPEHPVEANELIIKSMGIRLPED